MEPENKNENQTDAQVLSGCNWQEITDPEDRERIRAISAAQFQDEQDRKRLNEEYPFKIRF